HLDKKEKLNMLVAQNVLTQMDNLRTYPVIHSRLHKGELAIHGWLYNIENAQLLAYDEEADDFLPPHSKIYADIEAAKAVKPGGLSVDPSEILPPPFTEPVQPYWPGAHRLSPEQAARLYRGAAV
ncbi:MAG TPA: carbonic anhydrase, partial [Leptolyngbyaceae cyanobacterium M65_K2018_010]|nr:carbonic anhydrase [Leptolyngbyaceae cyanobacterium M65_K2018_010]